MALFLALLLFQAGPGQAREPARNWRFEHKNALGEYIVIVAGKEAVIVDLDKKIFDVRGVTGEYYTEPRRAGEKSQRIQIEAERGRLDESEKTLHLAERVRVTGKDDGTVIEAPEAVVDFHRGFECVACRHRQTPAGKCPRCDGPLKAKTFTTLRVDREFLLIKPGEASLTGEGLMADDALGQLTVARNGSLKMTGRPANLTGRGLAPEAPPAAPSGRDPVTRLSCVGPLSILELDDRSRALITARDKVRISREESRADRPGGFTVSCDSAEILVRKLPDPKDPKRTLPPEAEKVVARGNLAFEDNTGIRAGGEMLEWERESDVARLAGKPWVLAEQGKNKVRARHVEIRPDLPPGTPRAAPPGARRPPPPARIATFRDEVAAEFLPPDHGSSTQPPLRITASTLVARTPPPAPKGTPGTRGIEEISAQGGVEIAGLLGQAGQDAGVARADRFVYHIPQRRGRLEGTPFVRIVQGESLILAPLVALSGPHVVLKGPKRVRLVQIRDGKKIAVSLTAEGDIVVDTATGRMSMREACVVRSPEFTLYADRMEVQPTKDGKEIEALRGFGDVRVLRPAEGAVIYGERLRFDPRDQRLVVTGLPDAVADMGRSLIRLKEFRLGEKPRVEMIGGPQRVRIWIYEDLREAAAEGDGPK